jgi:hypothetical protein
MAPFAIRASYSARVVSAGQVVPVMAHHCIRLVRLAPERHVLVELDTLMRLAAPRLRELKSFNLKHHNRAKRRGLNCLDAFGFAFTSATIDITGIHWRRVIVQGVLQGPTANRHLQVEKWIKSRRDAIARGTNKFGAEVALKQLLDSFALLVHERAQMHQVFMRVLLSTSSKF